MNTPANIHPHEHKVRKADRNKKNGHRSFVLWFTGLSGSGKSTLAGALENKLFEAGIHTYLLDGDNLRNGLNADLGFSSDDRQENIRRVGEVSKLFADAGMVVLSAFISPFKEDRQKVRDIVGEEYFVEIFVDCPLDVCEQRDVKGLYQKARNGEIKDFTGIDSPYEVPESADLVIRSHELSIEAATEQLWHFIQEKHLI